MNTKFRTNKAIALIFMAAILTFFTSCDDDDDVAKPVISELELGIGNSKVAYISSDLHINAEIVAEGKIASIQVEIHPESEHGHDEWEYDSTYTEDFVGLKNATFHKHVDIDAIAEVGDYHLHFIVTDQEGNQTTVEEEIAIEELNDTEAPKIQISSAPENGKTYANGETITISGTITDNVSLAGMLVALVYEPDNIADADVTGKNTSIVIMLHTHNFETPKSHSFNASIAVGAANDNNMTPAAIAGDNAWKSGSYYILVKSKDAKSNGTLSARYPIVINL